LTEGKTFESWSPADVGFPAGSEVDPDELMEALDERLPAWTMIPQILCAFWPRDEVVHEFLWRSYAHARAGATTATGDDPPGTLILLNAGKFVTPEADAYRIRQLGRHPDDMDASVAVRLAVEGLALSRSADALPHLIAAGERHRSARGDILILLAGYRDDQLAPHAGELRSLLGDRRPNPGLATAAEAFDRLRAIVDTAGR